MLLFTLRGGGWKKRGEIEREREKGEREREKERRVGMHRERETLRWQERRKG